MLKNLLNQSELNTYKVIQSKLQDSGFYINVQTKLSSIFFKDSSILSISEQSYLASDSSFDFVVFDSDARPIFAVEFDGPSHAQYDKKIKNDIKKNSICSKMRLPFLRINDVHLKEQEGISLLEFMIDRFIKWQTERDQIIEDIQDYMSSISEAERSSLTEGGFLDPSIDPGFIFDCNNPFPGIRIIAERLLNIYRICSEYLPSNIQKNIKKKVKCIVSLEGTIPENNSTIEKYSYHIYVETSPSSGYKISNGELISDNILVLFQGKVEFSIQWTLPIVQDYDPKEGPLKYLLEKGRSPFYFQEIPGVHIPYIARQFCEYLGLKRIEEWAKDNEATILMGESKSIYSKTV